MEYNRITFMLPTLVLTTVNAILVNMKETYYKIQYFDKISMSYIDVQKKYFSIEELLQEVNKSKNWRVIVVEGKNRHPMLPSSLLKS